MSSLILERLQERWARERSNIRLRKSGSAILFNSVCEAGDSAIDNVFDSDWSLSKDKLEELISQVQYSCQNRISQYPLLSCLSLRAAMHADAEQIVVHKLKATLFFALVSEDETFNFITLSEAANQIRLLLSSTSYIEKIRSIPKQLSTLETLEYLCNNIEGRYTVSNAYLRMVMNGWSVCSNHKDKASSSRKSKIRLRRPNSGAKPLIHTTPFPFQGNDLDIEDDPDVETVDLDPEAISPVVTAERDIYRNQILTSREQFGLQFISYRLTPLEQAKLIQWINHATPSASSALSFLTMLTALKTHEVLGLHIALAESDCDTFKQSEECYGVINLEAGVYWRRELEIDDSYQPTSEDVKWLMPHSNWLKLPIPAPFLILLRTYFANCVSGLLEQVLPDEVVVNVSNELTTACQHIAKSGNFHRKLTHKMLRYFLFGCIAAKYGRHKASLIFANNEFGQSTAHYYMADAARNLQKAFAEVVTNELGFYLGKNFQFIDESVTVGSKLVINKETFTKRLSERIALLNTALRKVRNSRSRDFLRDTYNQLVSYTVLMFAVATSHRRNKSMFIEHYCWNDNYTAVLVADKIHFGESATRLIPAPNLLTRQIQNTLGWIEQIYKRVFLIDKKLAVRIKASIHRDSDASFLGLWQKDGSFDNPSTSQIAVFMGDDWSLPQNAMRQLSYQILFRYPEAAPYLDHQMGHVSSDMHSYQNTSLIVHESEEIEVHRNLLSRCLADLGFELLGRTSFSHSTMYNKGQFVPNSIRRKAGGQSKSAKKIIQDDLKSLLDESVATGQDFYELLAKHYSEDAYLHEKALTELKQLELSDGQDIISADDLASTMRDSFKKSPVASAILPYDTMLAERRYREICAVFYDFAQELLQHHSQIPQETLGATLLFSMILDGTGALSPLKLQKTVVIHSPCYVNGYLIAEMKEDCTTFFGGLSALLLAMIIKRGDASAISLDPIDLERLMNDRCPDNNIKSVAAAFKKLSALFRQLHDKKMTFSKLYQLIENAPKRSETGCLYGLRHGSIKVQGLSDHTLFRMLDRKHRYIIHATGPAMMGVVPERTFFNQCLKPNNYYKEFLSTFRRNFRNNGGNSTDRVISVWSELISQTGLKKLPDLVNASKELPEIIVLILTWLYKASGRKGQRHGGLAQSSISTYFSKVVPRLCEFAANKSLTTFFYEDFIELYQNVVDSGDVSNRSERVKILADFHSQIHETFGVPQFDFRALDVEASDQSAIGRIIMPWEYEQALSLLLADDDANNQERYTNAAILILCCRLGLRRKEIERIKLRDFSTEDCLLYVRTHRIFKETVRLKSKSGNRRVPYSLFLNDAELHILNWIVEQARAQNSKAVPVFFDSINPKELRLMDGQFNRVIEALKLVTGDPSMRLHDGRHTFVTFTATALVIDERQQDQIAKVVKEWVRCNSISEFQTRFKSTTIAVPSTRHSLLPALALMVGHSSATTTLSSYTHLLEYWRWLSVESDFKSVKKLDGTLSALAKINRKRLTEIKSEWGLSASYAVLKKTRKELVPETTKYRIEDFDQEPSLSTRAQDRITPEIHKIQRLERALRYLEDVEKIHVVSRGSDFMLQLNHQYGLTSHFVEQVQNAYQRVLTDTVSYRAYRISSSEEGVDFIGQPRLYEARGYFKDPSFHRLLRHLIELMQSNQQAYSELKQTWASAWYDSKKKLYIPTSQIDSASKVFHECQYHAEYGCDRINRRIGGVLYESAPIESLSLDGRTISIPQFSHAMFLITVSNQL
ncbi:site-specific integrase [Maribrevibacterium harenarium]|uniref:site-specific integrase n=1 Tax=Maribrevibacterium harenarium TaxID=2589817 RepID=UPI0015E46E67|nr:site-specific integrase [Maribrevibacterium harenarium]